MITMDSIKAMDFGREPTFVMVAPTQYAIIQAHLKFQGRNWRRIKREVNKAASRVRKPPIARS